MDMILNIETESAETILSAVESVIAQYNKNSFFKTSDTMKALALFVDMFGNQRPYDSKPVYLHTQDQVRLLHAVFGGAAYKESANTRHALAPLRYHLSGAMCFQKEARDAIEFHHSLFIIKKTVDTLLVYQCVTQRIIQRICQLHSACLDKPQFEGYAIDDVMPRDKTMHPNVSKLGHFSALLDRLNVIDLVIPSCPLLQPVILLTLLNDHFFVLFPAIWTIVSSECAKQLFSGPDGFIRFERLLHHPNAPEALEVIASVMAYMPALLATQQPGFIFDAILKPEWKVIALKEGFERLQSYKSSQKDLFLGTSTQLLECLIHLPLPDSERHVEGMRKIIRFIPYLPFMSDLNAVDIQVNILQSFVACSEVWLTSIAYLFFFEESLDYAAMRQGLSCEVVRSYLANEAFYKQFIMAARHPTKMVSWFGETPPQSNMAVSTVLIQLAQAIVETRAQWGRLPEPEELSLYQPETATNRQLPYALRRV